MMILIILTLVGYASCNVEEPWIELETGYTDYFNLNITTTLLQYKLQQLQTPYNLGFAVYTSLYTADSNSYVGRFGMDYKMSGNAASSNFLYITHFNPPGAQCRDSTVLQDKLPEQITWDLLSANVTIDSSAKADFSSCSYYEDWRSLVESGNITRARVKLSDYRDNVAGNLTLQYRLIRRPEFSTSPESNSIIANTVDTLTCRLRATSYIVSVQWYQGSDIIGSAGSDVISTLQVSEAGNYKCVATCIADGSFAGTATSDIATVTVLDFVTSPEDLTLLSGQTASLSCTVPNTTYHVKVNWYNSTNSLVQEDTGDHTNTQYTSTYKISESGDFYCKAIYTASDRFKGGNLTSDSVTVNILGSNIGAIVGGLAGAGGVIIIVILAACYIKRYRKSENVQRAVQVQHSTEDIALQRNSTEVIATEMAALTPLLDKVSSDLPSKKTDVFLTHDWGCDLGQDNHERVSFINDELKRRGYSTWFDSEKMTGHVMDQMCGGIDNTRVVLVFITDRYCKKVGGINENDNCKLEFNYAMRRKKITHLIPIVMESRMKDTTTWGGSLGMALGGSLYVDFTGDRKQNLNSFHKLEKEIAERL